MRLILKKSRFLFSFSCIIFYTLISSAQTDKPRIKYLSMKDGMSQVSVNDMELDNSGFVWIGTADGLNRYDGNVFKHYKHVPKDSTSISGNYITKVVQGKNNELWIGTRSNGLNKYNSVKDNFEQISLGSSHKNEIITGIVVDDNGGVLVSTAHNGLYLRGINENLFQKNSYLQKHSITNIFRDRKGILWVGNLNGKIYGFTNNYNNPEIEFNLVGNVQSFFRGYNHLFIGTYEGFFSYNFETKEVKSIELEDSGNFKTKHVLDFLKENDTHVWIATGRGLYLFDFLNFKVVKKIEYQEKMGAGLSNNTVQSLLRASPSLLYVGTANEITCLDFKTPSFKNISKNKKGLNILNDNVIFSIYKDDNLWVGTSDGGLNLITEKGVYQYVDNKNDPTTIVGSVVRGIVHDKKNNRMWFATTRGLSLLKLDNFNPKKPRFRNFYHDPLNTNSINSNFLKDLVLDSNDNLWGATHEHGIFRLEYNKNDAYKLIRYTALEGDKNSLVSNETNCLEIDKNNHIWVGTQDGVSKIKFDEENYQNLQVTNFKSKVNINETLAHKSVNDILVDDKNRVWFGTRNGLSLLTHDNNFKSWTKQEQFPNTLIYSIQDDLKGNLWLGTNDGLVKFNIETEHFSHYSVLDNIQGREFDTHARFRDSLGNIYFGGVDGVTFFNPDNLESLDEPQSLYFSQLQIKDEIIKPNEGVLKKSIESSTELKFNHNQFPFYLKFSSTDFRFNKNVKYAYRLLPIDEEWNALNDTEIQFLSLPIGKYTLQVNGFSRGKEWVKTPLSMSLVVIPPWWFTTTAIICYVVVIVLLAYWFYKFQISRKLALAESERLKEIDQLKNSLYTNITHEFRTPITVILGMVDTLESKLKKSSKDSEKPIKLIKQNSETLLKMVNNMLDLAKLESTEMSLKMIQSDVVSFVKYLFESFESLANEKQINYTFYTEEDKLLMDFDSDKLSTVVTNLIINAIKFTPSKGKIICHLKKTTDNNLYLKIVDSGIGIPENQIPNIFKKFYQADTSSQFQGTGIGLALTKELVELMKGTITVTSKEQKGSEFIIQLPITNVAKINIERFFSQEVESSGKSDLSFDNSFVLNGEMKSSIALIIEDNKDVAFYLKVCLQDKYKILYAKDGEEGISMALKYIPDIIISDVMMPKKDGFEVCRAIKNEITTNHIPIILLTAKASDRDKIEGLTYGADAYLIKPFNKNELFARIDQLVSLRKKMIAKFSKEDFKEFINKKDQNPETVFIKKVIEVVSDTLDNPKFGPSQLAATMHLSESQVYRKIKAVTNRSTSVFIRSIRINKAKLLLQTTNKTISEVAYEVGFNDPSWFSRAFKEEFGKSPSEFVKD